RMRNLTDRPILNPPTTVVVKGETVAPGEMRQGCLDGGAVERAVLDRLADVACLDRAAAVQVGAGPRDLEDARVGARAQPGPVDRMLAPPLPPGPDLAMGVQLTRAQLRVAENPRVRVTLELAPARAVDPLADRRRGLARRARRQLAVLYCRNLDVDVDT